MFIYIWLCVFSIQVACQQVSSGAQVLLNRLADGTADPKPVAVRYVNIYAIENDPHCIKEILAAPNRPQHLYGNILDFCPPAHRPPARAARPARTRLHSNIYKPMWNFIYICIYIYIYIYISAGPSLEGPPGCGSRKLFLSTNRCF